MPELPFQQVDDEKTWIKNRLLRDPLILSAAILAQWRQPVASRVAMDPLHRAMRLVSYRLTITASEMAGKYGAFSSFFLGNATLSSNGGIRCKYSTDDGVQWLRVKPWTPSISQCKRHCTSVSVRPSNWVGRRCIRSPLSIARSTITVAK